MDEKAKRAGEVWDRAAAIIGEENLKKLTAAGFVVAGRAEFNSFVQAHAAESQRLRDLLAARDRDQHRDSARAELIIVDGKVAALVTAPSSDESALAAALADKLGAIAGEMQVARFRSQNAPPPTVAAEYRVNAKGGTS